MSEQPSAPRQKSASMSVCPEADAAVASSASVRASSSKIDCWEGNCSYAMPDHERRETPGRVRCLRERFLDAVECLAHQLDVGTGHRAISMIVAGDDRRLSDRRQCPRLHIVRERWPDDSAVPLVHEHDRRGRHLLEHVRRPVAPDALLELVVTDQTRIVDAASLPGSIFPGTSVPVSPATQAAPPHDHAVAPQHAMRCAS